MKKFLGVAFVILLVIIGSIYAGIKLTPEKKLKIFNPVDVNPILVDDSLKNVAAFHKVNDFELLDQEGNLTTSRWLDDKIYVVDFFFTTCETICPVMSSQMQRASENLKDETDVKFISFSVLPEQDSVPVLKAYAEQLQIDYDQWRLLTGDKHQIYDLARKSYFALKPTEAGKGDGGKSDFIHTNNFVLVDKNKRIRGYYSGTNNEDVKRMLEEIRILSSEQM
ncbi:MAG: SCO family protein [Bacteroidota bacterium]